MSLEEILKKNGTGLLEGLCRVRKEKTNFEDIYKDFPENVELNFSLGAEYLGSYHLKIESRNNPNDDKKMFGGVIKTETKSIYLEIDYSLQPDFGRFYAILT